MNCSPTAKSIQNLRCRFLNFELPLHPQKNQSQGNGAVKENHRSTYFGLL
jgi:hypothetical protein